MSKNSPLLPSIREIARHSGCSKSLVALALRDDHRVAAETRARIQAVAQRLGYRPNPVVAHLMAQLRISRHPAFQSNLAVINCSQERDIYWWHTFQDFRAGAQASAAQMGYAIDDFWLHEPDMHPKRLAQILRARQIPGIIFVAALDPEVIHGLHEPLWSQFPCAAVGIVKTQPQIACSACDHFQTSRDATLEVLRRSYRRPALAIESSLDHLLDRRFSGGFLSVVEALPARSRVPIFLSDLRDRDRFLRWYRRHRPDCILTLHHEVRDWLEESGARGPEAPGLVHLDWHEALSGWAGMVQSNYEVGASAVATVIQQLHANHKGAPSCPSITMIESRWCDGDSIRPA